MIYLYDNAITQDLIESFNPLHCTNPAVRVVDPESAIGLAAQLHNDDIRFPIVALYRDPNVQIDTSLTNFTRSQIGAWVATDPTSNIAYQELSTPIQLKYAITILTTRVADMDEIVKELYFKYTSMYFLTIELPYECTRKIRFGISIDTSSPIQQSTTPKDYLSGGMLHQTILPIACDGCVLISNRPVKLRRIVTEGPNLI
jgi:hypothetical protein